MLMAPWMQNRLAGPIPPTLAALPNLAVLDLGNNSLSGGQLGGVIWCHNTMHPLPRLPARHDFG